MKILAFAAISACAWAQIEQPQLGKMLDASGSVRTVYGIARSVTVGDAEISGVLSSACSQTLCLAKTPTSVVSATGSAASPIGPALFSFDSDRAYIWFPRSRQLASWQNDALTPIDTTVDGEVLSIRATAGQVEFAVRRSSGDWLVKSDGTVIDALPSSQGPVMLIPGATIYATPEGLAIRDVRIPLARIAKFSWMSNSYVQVHAGGLDYALRIDQGRETLFQLPGARQ